MAASMGATSMGATDGAVSLAPPRAEGAGEGAEEEGAGEGEEGYGEGVGEVAIGGAQLARGYVRLAELTRRRFILCAAVGAPLYLTGDLGRWVGTECGTPRLRLLGRADRQVKLNGVRLELGEVEGALLRCTLAAAASVVVLNGALVAAVQPVGGLTAGDGLLGCSAVALLGLHCRRWLPLAVCPRRILLLDALPLTPTGKVDRGQLTQQLPSEVEAEEARWARPAAETAPIDALEAVVCAVWAEVLLVPRVHRHSNFMALGGDSIRALQVRRGERQAERGEGGGGEREAVGGCAEREAVGGARVGGMSRHE